MEFKSNNLFKQWVSINIEPEKFGMCEFTHDLLGEDIVAIDDCYFFKSLNPGWVKFNPNKYLIDKTGAECFHNKIRIDDISSADSPDEHIKCGLYFAYHLAKNIEATLGNSFNIILSYNKEHCFIRFHKIRIGEEWLDDNLENYKFEAILLITT